MNNPLGVTNAQASANIIKFASESRLAQRTWHDRQDGKEIACLLGAIHPSVTRPSDCNGDLMPMWLAELTPVLFDGLPANKVTEIGLKYGRLINGWHVLKPENWQAVQTRFLIKLVDTACDAAEKVASQYAYWQQVKDACTQVKNAINTGSKSELAAADAARAAAYAAADAADAADAAAHYNIFNSLLDCIEAELIGIK